MAMRPVSTRTHGIIDYITGPTLLAAPKIFRIEDGPVSSASPRLTGAGATAYSLLTDYELGAVKAVPMRVHLALDAVGGAALARPLRVRPRLGTLACGRAVLAPVAPTRLRALVVAFRSGGPGLV